VATLEQTTAAPSAKLAGRTPPPSWALIRRDFIGELRQRRSFALAVLVVGICILLVSVGWPRTSVRIQDAGRYARDLFGLFGVVHLVAATVLPPGLAALAFASERRQETLDQLRLSLISPLGLVLAKLLASVGLVALLFVATLPALGVQMLLVGVALSQVVSLIVVVLATAFMTGAVGLLCAVVFRRPLVALVASYIGVVLVHGGWIYVVMIPFILLYFLLGEEPMEILFRLFERLVGRPFIDGFARLLARGLVGPYEAIWGSAGASVDIVLAAAGYRGLVGALCILIAVRILRKPEKPLRVPKERPIDDAVVLWERRHRFPYYLVDPLRRREPIADTANPILVRELRHGLGMRLHVVFRLFMVTTLIVGLMALWWSWPSGGLNRYGSTQKEGMTILILLTIIVVQVLAANVITKEREYGNLGLLRMTLLTPYDVFRGKVAAGLVTLSPFLLALLVAGTPVFILALVLGHGGPPALFFGFMTLLSCAWLSFCAAFYMSACSRTTAQSFVGGFALNFVIYGIPPLSYLALEALDVYLHSTEVMSIWKCILMVSPLLSYANMNFRENWVTPHPQSGAVGIEIVLALALAVGLGFALLGLAYLRLQKYEERDE
jgi:hypothetical protein